MPRYRRGFASLAAVLLLCTVPSLAINAGHIQGRIYDENGKPIEGALVTVGGDAAVGIWRCRSDSSGFYRVAGLPASTDLRITVESGGTALERSGYRVKTDATLHLDYTLRPRGVYSTLVLTDASVPYHGVALAAALESLPPGAKVLEVSSETGERSRQIHEALAERPDGILAIGALAARTASENALDIPVVHALVPDPDRESLIGANLSGVPSNVAFSEPIEILQGLSPKRRRIGTIFDPSRLDDVVRQLRVEAEGAGFALEARSARGISEIRDRLDSLARAGIDSFILLLDPALITPPVFEQIRSFAEERHIVLLVPDASMAGSGATYAYGPGFRGLGAYAGRMLTRGMQRRATIEDGAIHPRT